MSEDETQIKAVIYTHYSSVFREKQVSKVKFVCLEV